MGVLEGITFLPKNPGGRIDWPNLTDLVDFFQGPRELNWGKRRVGLLGFTQFLPDWD